MKITMKQSCSARFYIFNIAFFTYVSNLIINIKHDELYKVKIIAIVFVNE